jgi:lipoprotein-anchoring transpeptidase ErfK/SrfK
VRRAIPILALGLAAAAACAVALHGGPSRPRSGVLGAETTRRAAGLVARPLHGTVVLRAAPAGRPVATVGPRGVFGDPLRLGVVARRGAWLEVTAEALPNGRYGWVRAGRDVAIAATEYGLHVSLSAHRLDVLRNGKVVRRIAVAIGAASSPTPTGRYAVSEKLDGTRFGAAYGCCILGLTAHQPRPPEGWRSGVAYFVAIHGGGGVGTNVSAGCLHAAEADLRYLMATVPLGAPIRIAA